MTRIAALWSSRERLSVTGYKETEQAAQAVSLQLHPVEVQTGQDFETAFAEMAKHHDNALVVILSVLVTLHSKQIAELALKHRIAGMFPTSQFVDEGGLMAYGPLIGDLYRRAATYVDKILKGANPADLPIEQPTKFELVINLKTAKQIDLTIRAERAGAGGQSHQITFSSDQFSVISYWRRQRRRKQMSTRILVHEPTRHED